MPTIYNKIELDGTTLMDISDTTAVASDVASGKYFYTASGVKTAGTASGGGTAAISVVDTLDSHGGTIREITALDISDTTAVASDVASGKYFYTASGVKTAGTASGGGSPSVTQHTIYFEFTDGTDTTIPVYYDNALLATMITSYIPETYGQKTVDSASLDNVTWYTRPTEVWETLFDDDTHINGDDYVNNFWISDLGSVYPTNGSVWRITMLGNTYVLTATAYDGTVYIGNPKYRDEQDDGSDTPFVFFNAGWGAWTGYGAVLASEGSYNVKVERLITS